MHASGTYPLHPDFKSFYEKLGGLARLGPAISPPIERDGKRYQYTTAVLLELDIKTGKVQLSPIGYEFGFRSASSDRVYLGKTDREQIGVYPLFEKLYTEMGGEQVIGFPLSDVHYNEKFRRYEQYFERAGFYLLEEDASQTVYLLSYGAWKCRQSCSFSIPENSRVDLPTIKADPIVAFVYRYGVEFSGFALSEPYLASDGMVEQIFENLVLTFNPEHPEQVDLRALPQLLGIPTDPLEEKQSLTDHEWVSVAGEKGFLVPKRFWDYLQAHGGLELSGFPQTKPRDVGGGRQQQCFVKLCLEDQIDLYGKRVVRLSKLGEAYRKQTAGESAGKAFEISQITLRVWESQPIVSPDRQQKIGVSVYAGNQPLSGITPYLFLTNPQDGEEEYSFPPTDLEGKTELKIASIEAENGTLVPYRVCVQDHRQQRYCVRDSFLVWKTDELDRKHVLYLPAIFHWLEQSYQIFLPILSR
ncbi:MAG: hypothetical protein Kow0088_24580 [Anaerolineales bacterium]